MQVAVIGTGLIGTSVALALRERGATVWLADEDPEAVRLAANLGAGEPLPDGATADVAVIAVPPTAVAATLAAAGHPVSRLVRTDVGPIRLGNLKPGTSRELTTREIGELYAAVGL